MYFKGVDTMLEQLSREQDSCKSICVMNSVMNCYRRNILLINSNCLKIKELEFQRVSCAFLV